MPLHTITPPKGARRPLDGLESVPLDLSTRAPSPPITPDQIPRRETVVVEKASATKAPAAAQKEAPPVTTPAAPPSTTTPAPAPAAASSAGPPPVPAAALEWARGVSVGARFKDMPGITYLRALEACELAVQPEDGAYVIVSMGAAPAVEVRDAAPEAAAAAVEAPAPAVEASNAPSSAEAAGAPPGAGATDEDDPSEGDTDAEPGAGDAAPTRRLKKSDREAITSLFNASTDPDAFDATIIAQHRGLKVAAVERVLRDLRQERAHAPIAPRPGASSPPPTTTAAVAPRDPLGDDAEVSRLAAAASAARSEPQAVRVPPAHIASFFLAAGLEGVDLGTVEGVAAMRIALGETSCPPALIESARKAVAKLETAPGLTKVQMTALLAWAQGA